MRSAEHDAGPVRDKCLRRSKTKTAAAAGHEVISGIDVVRAYVAALGGSVDVVARLGRPIVRTATDTVRRRGCTAQTCRQKPCPAS